MKMINRMLDRRADERVKEVRGTATLPEKSEQLVCGSAKSMKTG